MSIAGDTSDADVRSGIEHLRRRNEITRQVRYSAAARLRREKTAARLVVSILSLVIITFSIAILVFASRFSNFQVALVNVVIIAISLYIIVINYEFDRRDFDKTVLNLERSTAQLRELQMEINDDGKVLNKAALAQFNDAYNNILREYPYHTDDRDYNFVLLKFPTFRSEARVSRQTKDWVTAIRHQGSILFAVIWLTFPTLLIAMSVAAIVHIGVLPEGSLPSAKAEQDRPPR
jgi:Ca2+/Na+ antiporter